MYTATIIRNFRDVKTTTPKVLLLNITDKNGQLFRDHCWVTINELIEKYIPIKNNIKKIIKFDAIIKEYQTNGPKKQTLISFKDICLIGEKIRKWNTN